MVWRMIGVCDMMNFKLYLVNKIDMKEGICNLKCPLGGDETNDCADCSYAGDYHFVDGECVKRGDC